MVMYERGTGWIPVLSCLSFVICLSNPLFLKERQAVCEPFASISLHNNHPATTASHRSRIWPTCVLVGFPDFLLPSFHLFPLLLV